MAEAELRWAAELGYLTNVAGSPDIQRAAYALVLPLTFERHTRQLEHRRGHPACARSFTAMPAECLDRFHDDVLAVRDHLLQRCHAPVRNLEGWIVRRLNVATIDGHRRRRGEVGAQQKPHVPKRLAAALGDDPWLVRLATLMLGWAGIPTTAGDSDWPTHAWAEVRARCRGVSSESDPANVTNDIGRVIEVMRRVDEAWYQRYINAPMGRKPIPVYEDAGAETATDTTVIAAASRAREDRWVAQSAEMLVEAIRLSVVAGREPPTDVVRRLLTTFREVSADAIGDTARCPCTAAAAADDAIMSLLSPERIERLIPQILDILGVADVAARDQQPRRTRIELDDIRRRGPSAASDRPSGAQRVA